MCTEIHLCILQQVIKLGNEFERELYQKVCRKKNEGKII